MATSQRTRKRSYIRSIQVCDAQLATNPSNAALLGKRGEAKRKLGHYASAILDFDAGLTIKPASALMLAGRGSAKRSLGRLEEAVADFNAALKLDPTSVSLLIGRHAALRSVGRFDEAMRDLDTALAVNPRSNTALQLRGEMRRKQGDLDGALVDFDVALRQDPRCAAALAGRGAVRRALGKQAECIPDYDAALRLEPTNAAVLAGRGGAKLELGRYEDALSDFDRALKFNPEEAYARWGRDMALKQRGGKPLQTITLAGFMKEEMNSKYVERRQLEFTVNDRDTYWSEGGDFFLYWCNKEKRWKGSRSSDLPEVQGGRSCGFISSPLGQNLLAPSLAKGWHEWDGQGWILRPSAGISSASTLSAAFKTLTLRGFVKQELNLDYIERREPFFTVNGRETFWAAGSLFFIYWCKKETRWKCARAEDLQRVQAGGSLGFIGSPVGTDLMDLPLRLGWHEWDGFAWVRRPEAGVVGVKPDPVINHSDGQLHTGNGLKRQRDGMDPPKRRLPEVPRFGS